MSSLTEQQAEQKVRSWGFKNVFTRVEEPHAHFKPHKHTFVTTHYILSGTFIVAYPEQNPDKKETFGPGGRIDVPIGKVHEVWIGENGCKLIIGEGLEGSQSKHKL
ncbi:hypothetical protein K474DRAFT_217715 [Panus rudis PR-1116 ss-1]|nr:hypothetical protein K474DRAFT_217715 [Panus rudis PR-1116 ss-1]